MKNKFILLLALTIPIVNGCEKTDEKPILTPKQLILPANSPGILAKSNSFGIELFKNVSEAENSNLMLSPLSASIALTMLLNGCSTNTYDQIHSMLNYGNLTLTEINSTYQELVDQLIKVDPQIKITIANAVFYREGYSVKTPFLNTMMNDYSSHVEGLDFNLSSALTTINGWASDNTFGKIPKVLDKIESDAVMFLMNALYFKGNWTYQFAKDKTKDGQFTKSDGSTINVKMMDGEVQGKFTNYGNSDVFELPYGRTNYTMIIAVPNENLDGFTNDLNIEYWDNITANLDSQESFNSLLITMPKFKFEYEKVLNDQLKALGMIDAFDPTNADLSGISDADLYVSFVKQNTFVDVNEEGTEAAAVTTIGIVETSVPQSYVVNKPFIFAIRERTTNTLLFIGKVENPVY